jgi:4-amino-4-deoxy-L-arabinose transferase-like glycosyltransferase
MNHRSPPTDYRLPLEKIAITAITLLAFALRVWQLDVVPAGWRDDELINVLVISQKVLDGNWQFYYADASGNEAFYHALNAVMFGLFGANFLGIRLLSAFWGVTAVPLTWLLGRKLFGSWVGLLAAAALAISFWSLMYSRFGLRQIVTPTLMLLAFYFFWRGLTDGRWQVAGGKWLPLTAYRLPFTDFVLAGFWTALGFYVYFAGRGVPLILLGFCVAMVLVARPLLRQQWRGIVLMFVVTAVLALPLFITLQQQPAAEARVSELAAPLIKARQGDFTLVQKHLLTTLSMFHADGDDEWLYNIPHRAIFGPMGALFLWAGVVIAAYYALVLLWHSLARQTNDELGIRNYELPLTAHRSPITDYGLPTTFLLIWWFVGLSPGFISIPPASLGHTILAQPATFMLMALPVQVVSNWAIKRKPMSQLPNYQLPALLSVLLLVSIAIRDIPDYFVNWPQRGMVRFLYHTDYFELADYLNQHPSEVADFAVPGLLAGPWARLALEIELNERTSALSGAETAVTPRWYHPERAVFIRPSLSLIGSPNVPFAYDSLFEPLDKEPVGDFEWAQVDTAVDTTQATCFQNGLCSVSATFDAETGILELGWEVARPLQLPPFELISNPPPPGVYAGPRLLAFGQLLDAEGNFVTGDDGFWVDPYRLQPGDIFLQQHHLSIPAGIAAETIAFGLYDPLTGERILTDDGRDHLTLNVGE